ncbi:hypothetical protein B0H14DRAFT_3473721 [Mycena olivaceomarginata]|nr:hypothetical protein B0H14DRAFT_3473721 [Mycena olivaceomarginata]
MHASASPTPSFYLMFMVSKICTRDALAAAHPDYNCNRKAQKSDNFAKAHNAIEDNFPVLRRCEGQPVAARVISPDVDGDDNLMDFDDKGQGGGEDNGDNDEDGEVDPEDPRDRSGRRRGMRRHGSVSSVITAVCGT